jgi:hypothetical protein
MKLQKKYTLTASEMKLFFQFVGENSNQILMSMDEIDLEYFLDKFIEVKDTWEPEDDDYGYDGYDYDDEDYDDEE